MAKFAPLFCVLLAAYGLTLLLGDAVPGTALDTPEAHVLLTTESIVSDGDIDLRDEFRSQAWRSFTGERLEPTALLTGGRLHEPQGAALPLVLAPAYAIGGETGARLLLAALTALAFCLAAAIAGRLVPDPWPRRAALVVGLSPPVLGAATSVAPEPVAAAALAGAALFALRVRDDPRSGAAAACAVLAAALPWLAPEMVVPAVVVAFVLARWMRRRRRGVAGFVALEVLLFSGVLYVTINDRLYGGVTPDAAALPGSRASGTEGLLWLGAPVLALLGVAAWRLWHSHRERLALLVGDQIDVEVGAAFLGLLVLSAVGAAAVPWSGGGIDALLVGAPAAAGLVAWAWPVAGPAGTALAALTLGASAAVLVA